MREMEYTLGWVNNVRFWLSSKKYLHNLNVVSTYKFKIQNTLKKGIQIRNKKMYLNIYNSEYSRVPNIIVVKSRNCHNNLKFYLIEIHLTVHVVVET